MPTKKISTSPDRVLLGKLRKAFRESSDPELRELEPHVVSGLRVLQYMFDALDAAETVKPPPGIKVGSIEVCVKKTTDKKAIGALTAASWMLDRVKEQVGYKDEKDDIE